MTASKLSVERTQLSNGLCVIMIPTPGSRRVVLDLHTLIGSRYETQTDNGISHFLEHMLHRGTRRYPSAHELALALEERGAQLSAATYVDHGVLSVSMPASSTDQILPVLGELLREPVYSGIDIEKGIVREEILEGLDEDGKLVDADYLLRAETFADHALGFPITGTLETLETFDVTALAQHHRERYVAEGSVLTLAGALDFAKYVPALEAAFGDLPNGTPPAATAPPAQTGPRFSYVRYPGSQTALRLGFRAPAENDPDEPAAELLLRVIDDGMATRLYHEICDARGLCYDVSAAYEAYADSGLLDFAAETAHERATIVFRELLAIASALRDEGPSEAELDKAKARVGYQIEEMFDVSAELTSYYGLTALTGIWRTPEERVEQLRSTSRDRVREVARKIFRRDTLSAVAVGNIPKRVQDALRKAIDSF